MGGIGAPVRVSVTNGGGLANGRSATNTISFNGSAVAFVSSATNLVAGDTNGVDDVFVRDRNTNQTIRIQRSFEYGARTDGRRYASPLAASLVSRRQTSFAGHRAFFALNEDLRPTLRAHVKRRQELRHFERPVRILFGAADPYLNANVARDLSRLFPHSDLHLVAGARHFVQMDEPERVAAEITRN